MSRCPYCGRMNDDFSRFCMGCGQPLLNQEDQAMIAGDNSNQPTLPVRGSDLNQASSASQFMNFDSKNGLNPNPTPLPPVNHEKEGRKPEYDRKYSTNLSQERFFGSSSSRDNYQNSTFTNPRVQTAPGAQEQFSQETMLKASASSHFARWASVAAIVLLILAVTVVLIEYQKAQTVNSESYTAGMVLDEYNSIGGSVTQTPLQTGQKFEVESTKEEDGVLWGKRVNGGWVKLEDQHGLNAVKSDRIDFSLLVDGRGYVAKESIPVYPLPDTRLAPRRSLMMESMITIRKQGTSADGRVWGQLEDGCWVVIQDDNGLHFLLRE